MMLKGIYFAIFKLQGSDCKYKNYEIDYAFIWSIIKNSLNIFAIIFAKKSNFFIN